MKNLVIFNIGFLSYVILFLVIGKGKVVVIFLMG